MAAEAAEPSSSYTPVCGSSSETLLDSPSNSSLSDVSLPIGTPPSSPSISNGHIAGPPPHQHPGPKFKLITEGDLQLCRLNHTRTIVSKIMNSKYLRRWEGHHVILGENDIYSTTVSVTNTRCDKQSTLSALQQQPCWFLAMVS